MQKSKNISEWEIDVATAEAKLANPQTLSFCHEQSFELKTRILVLW